MRTLALALAATLLLGVAAQAQAGPAPATSQPTVESDAAESLRFDRWMASVRRLAPRYGYRIGEHDEDWEEWFWLYYFLEGVSPRKALADTVKYDRELRARKKRQRR